MESWVPQEADSEMGIYIQEVYWGVYLGINPVLWGKKGSRIRQRERLGCGAVTTKLSSSHWELWR